MRHTSNTSRSITKFLNDPASQGILTGALTLIPARKYPKWVRQTLIWGPTVAGAAGAAYLKANPRLRRKLSAKLALAQHADPSTRTSLRPQEPPLAILPNDNRSTASMVVTGTAIGTGVSLLIAASLWADEKIEQGLRQLKTPLPRVVMGVAAGAVTWWALKRDQERSAPDTSVS